MKRKQLLVKKGGTVKVGLPVGSVIQQMHTSQKSRGDDEEGSKLINPGESEDDYYVRRKKGNITIYDLSTQPMGGSVLISINTFDDFDNRVRTAFSSFPFYWRDNLSTAKQLPLASESLFVDLNFNRRVDVVDGDEYNPDTLDRVIVGRANKRPVMARVTSEFHDYHTGLVPYPDNDNTDWKDTSLAFTKPGQWNLFLESAFFNSFHTQAGQSDFKVTNLFDSSAVEAELLITKNDKIKIYLTPRLYIIRNSIAFELPYAIFSFSMLTPSFNLTFDPRNLFANPGTIEPPACAINTTVPQWASVVNFVHGVGGYSVEEEGAVYSFDINRISPVLVAIIIKNDVSFYVWRLTGSSMLFTSTAIYNPLS